ncbi:PAQR family membrane homeostasis protein TrhA [Stratiformator vulcanicus]|uniref:Hemolysin-III related n=1 Tax=Stratiformator vulcanicus TaxID=2527980 RepID=A0A517QZ73_9PLAN|nr:hemolysin III family protein [Stratiformator vulcanicus]QDT36945.1 hemolysin-III related [Stratiformator vulcanicus]
MSQSISVYESGSLFVRPERLNQITHAFGFALTIPAAIALVSSAVVHSDAATAIGCLVYSITLCGTYLASTLSHSFDDRPAVKDMWRVIDQVFIFSLIAGSYTPFAIVHAPHTAGIAALIAMWVLCIGGMIMRIVRRGKPLTAAEVGYCLMIGWVPLVTLPEIMSTGGIPGFSLVIAGGVLYTGGTFFLMNDHRHPAMHAVWHLCTIGGGMCHYFFLLLFTAA